MSGQSRRARGLPGAAAIMLIAAMAASAEDIRDIRSLRQQWPAWVTPAAVAGIIVITLAAYALRRRLRRRPMPLPSPLELAERRLDGIRVLMTPAESGRFAVEICAVVRDFVEQIFDVRAGPLTSEEFLRRVLEFPDAALARHRPLLSAFLSQCDLAKFAGVALNRETMEALHRSAVSFVRQSAGREEAHDPLP